MQQQQEDWLWICVPHNEAAAQVEREFGMYTVITVRVHWLRMYHV